MAYLKAAKTEEEVRKLTLSNVRKAYNELASYYNKLVDEKFLLCPKCNEFMARDNFYTSKEYATGLFPVCKKCLLAMAEQRQKKTDKPNETKESVQNVLKFMNLPYYDPLYEDQCRKMANDVTEDHYKSPFLVYLTLLKSLPQYIGKTWKDSNFGVAGGSAQDNQMRENQRTIKNGRKRFGNYSNEDLMYLETEYQDWISRYECNTKAQESIFRRLSFKQWEIDKATREGKPTKDLDKTFQELLATANIQPRQNSMDSLSDAQTLGTLIQKYEETRPLPEIDPELQDVDKIGLYIDTFYRGHASKMLGLKNRFSNLYEKVMSKYTVKRPEYDEDSDSEDLFERIFTPLADEEE